MYLINKEIESFFPQECAVIFMHAHPDDESFLSFGLISELHRRNIDVYVYYCAATNIKDNNLTQKRQDEAKRALDELPNENIIFLDFCDSCYKQENALSQAKQSDILNSIFQNLRNIQKSVILVSYDKNGGYGHIDHLIVHGLGRDIKNRCKKVKRLYEITLARDIFNKWIKKNAHQAQKYLPQTQYWNKEYGLPTEEIDYVYILSLQQALEKRKKLSVHSSQISSDEFPLCLTEEDFLYLFGKEYIKEVIK